MRDTKACRACLNTEGGLKLIPDSWYRLFESLSGVQASKDDGYPSYLCIECKSHLHKAIAFRKKSRRAFYILKEIMMIRKEVKLPDIQTVNRESVNLKSSIEIWKPENFVLFDISSLEDGNTVLVKTAVDKVKFGAVIGIKCDSEVVPPEDNEPMPEDDHVDQFDDHGDDDFGAQDLDAEVKTEPKQEIDMEDIFKGLEEPASENPNEDHEEELNEDNKENGKVDKKKKKKKGVEANDEKERRDKFPAMTKARALVDYDIKKLTEEEQREVFLKRTSHPIFRRALYSCGICVKVLPSSDALMDHFDLHKRKTQASNICKICKDKFETVEELEQHVQMNHLYLYTCKICREDVYSIQQVVKHKRYKHVIVDCNRLYNATDIDADTEAELLNNFLYIPLCEEDKVKNFIKSKSTGGNSCQECGMQFPIMSQLKSHSAQHKIPRNLSMSDCKKCGICGVWFKRPSLIERHMEIFHNYTYYCKQCNHEAPSRLSALAHMKVHINNKCEHCGIIVKTEYGMRIHKIKKHYAQLYKHHCVICGHSATKATSLYAHQFREHNFFKLPEPPTEDGEHVCKHCNVQFLSERAYNYHIVKTGHEDAAADLPWKCMPCKKLFDSEQEFKTHVVEYCLLIGSFPSECKVCGVMVDNHKEYKKHCLKTHSNYTSILNKRKLCDACGKSYRKRCSCADEKIVKPGNYKCSVCDIEFNKAKSVVFHVLDKHAEKPFSCTLCPQTYKRRQDCRDHILKKHAPVRPYVCPICDREFSHLDFLKKHARTVHDVKVQLDRKKIKLRKFFVYPNMKVDLSLIDKSIIDDVKVEVADYTNQIFEVVKDYSDYIITNEDVRRQIDEEYEMSKRRRVIKTENEE